jgi:hypothetical protein
MKPSEEINRYIALHPDWRGDTLAEIRKIILGAEPNIVEEWKWMGSPVWEQNGIICVGNIFKNKVQLVFMNGVALSDPDKLFNAGLEGNQRRSIDVFEENHIEETSLKTLVRAAISYNQSKAKK